MGANALIVPPQTGSNEPVGICLLGMNHCEYGILNAGAVGQFGAVAMSVGSDDNSPSNRFKTDSEVPNEDSLCYIESGAKTLFAVADAHYGPESSHTLVERLFNQVFANGVPSTPAELSFVLDSLQDGPYPETESETTLLVAIYDRQDRSGFGVSFGDSSLVVVGADGARLTNPHNSRYVSTSPDQLPLEGAAFSFDAQEGDTLFVFTDGINECHYRSPETSVTPEHISEIVSGHSDSVVDQVSKLGSLALTGVNGNPGGQDNIALVASQA